MAINPLLTTTVQAKDLPPAPLSPSSILVHEVGDLLSRFTLEEFIDYIRAQSTTMPYEIKYIRAPNPDYITDNFDMTPGATQGLGKPTGLWPGFAICNGNNGTDNDDGVTDIGFGANYATVGQFSGAKEVILNTNQIPSHRHLNGVADGQDDIFVYGGTNADLPGASTVGIDNFAETRNFQGYTSYTGGGQAHNNMQPSRVMLKIMKLP